MRGEGRKPTTTTTTTNNNTTTTKQYQPRGLTQPISPRLSTRTRVREKVGGGRRRRGGGCGREGRGRVDLFIIFFFFSLFLTFFFFFLAIRPFERNLLFSKGREEHGEERERPHHPPTLFIPN